MSPMNAILMTLGLLASAVLAPAIYATAKEWRRKTCHACWIEAQGPSTTFISHSCSRRRWPYKENVCPAECKD